MSGILDGVLGKNTGMISYTVIERYHKMKPVEIYGNGGQNVIWESKAVSGGLKEIRVVPGHPRGVSRGFQEVSNSSQGFLLDSRGLQGVVTGAL